MDITVGKTVEFSKAFTAEEVRTFAAVSEDDNPIHLDEAYAADSRFGQRIVHGMLVSSLFSKIFGTIYPGPGCIYISQTTEFLKPVFLGEKITARVTLTEYNTEKNRGTFRTECIKPGGETAIRGNATILFPKSDTA